MMLEIIPCAPLHFLLGLTLMGKELKLSALSELCGVSPAVEFKFGCINCRDDQVSTCYAGSLHANSTAYVLRFPS